MNYHIELKAGLIYIFSQWLTIWSFMHGDFFAALIGKIVQALAAIYYCIKIYKELKNKKSDVG